MTIYRARRLAHRDRGRGRQRGRARGAGGHPARRRGQQRRRHRAATTATAPTAASWSWTPASTTSRPRCSPRAAAGWPCGRATGREVGWFDDDFFLYYEDTDLSWRLRADGWAIRYQPTAVLRHLHSASSTEWSPLWRVPRRPQPAADADQGRVGPAGPARGAALPAHLGVDAGHGPAGRDCARGPGRPCGHTCCGPRCSPRTCACCRRWCAAGVSSAAGRCCREGI